MSTSAEDFIGEVEADQNKKSVKCLYCSSIMLKPQTASFTKSEFQLPLMHQKKSETEQQTQTELLSHFWIVDNMFIFENMGFSNTVDQTKFLVCADCEMGPIGYQDIPTKKCFVALARVNHAD